jgi:hypothetical protein
MQGTGTSDHSVNEEQNRTKGRFANPRPAKPSSKPKDHLGIKTAKTKNQL